MFIRKLTDRIFASRSVQEVLADTAAGYISVLPHATKMADKATLFDALNNLGENAETITELLADGDIARLQRYYASIEPVK